jgi:2-polyprenyl-6-hydroxyphenyl methylase/3-demethylubiquinone-9 3-methyltransferase
MWKAIAAAADLVAPIGLFWLALYVKGPRYAADLALKRRYNTASPLVKKMMIWQRVAHRMVRIMRRGRNPFRWNERKARGMDTYHDIVDWVGGYPYEVASREETVAFLRERKFLLERIEEHQERWNNIYLFAKG